MSIVLGLDATSAAAAGTIALAVVGVIGILFNIAVVKAANKQAEASSQTVDEMRLSRELEWRPHLKFIPLSADTIQNHNPAYGPLQVPVTNIGRGIALNICGARFGTHPIAGRTSAEARISSLFLLGPSESRPVSLSGELTPGHDYNIAQALCRDLLHPLPPADASEIVDVCVCEDEFGNKFRFRERGQQFDSWSKVDQGEPPAWTQWHESEQAAKP